MASLTILSVGLGLDWLCKVVDGIKSGLIVWGFESWLDGFDEMLVVDEIENAFYRFWRRLFILETSRLRCLPSLPRRSNLPTSVESYTPSSRSKPVFKVAVVSVVGYHPHVPEHYSRPIIFDSACKKQALIACGYNTDFYREIPNAPLPDRIRAHRQWLHLVSNPRCRLLRLEPVYKESEAAHLGLDTRSPVTNLI